MARRKFNTSYSFIDLLVNMLQAFFLLLLLVITSVNPESKKNNKEGDVVLKAEYLITMEWPKNDPSDIDLMLKTPTKQICFYGRQNIPGASLDRDDTGFINDVFKLDDGTIMKVEDNWEHISIRKAIPGEYVVNVLLFRKSSAGPIPVTVKVEKLNPYQVIYSGTVMLNTPQEEKTVIAFKIDKNGVVKERSTLQQSLSPLIRGARP